MKLTATLASIVALALAAPQAVPPPPTTVPHSVCAGSGGEAQSDIIACPLQPGAVDLLTGGAGSDNSGTYKVSYPKGQDNGEQDGQPFTTGCICVNGNFCCDGNAQVPGGQSAVDYFTDVGCNCSG